MAKDGMDMLQHMLVRLYHNYMYGDARRHAVAIAIGGGHVSAQQRTKLRNDRSRANDEGCQREGVRWRELMTYPPAHPSAHLSQHLKS